MKKRLNPANFSLLPTSKNPKALPEGGLLQEIPKYCKKNFDSKCVEHYRTLSLGFRQCPYGLTSYKSVDKDGRPLIYTGIKVLGHCDRNALQRSESAKMFKFYTEQEINNIFDRNMQLTEALDAHFDEKIDSEKQNLEHAKKLSNSAFHEIKPLNAEIKAAINRIRSSLGKTSDTDKEAVQKALEQLKNIESAAKLISFRMDQRDVLLNPLILSQAQNEEISVRREIDRIHRLFGTTLKKNSTSMKYSLEDKRFIKTKSAFNLVLFVLIENAIKFSPASADQEIWVKDQDVEGKYIITISSVGPLIELDERVRIFEAFTRGKHAKEEGTGIGLFLASRVCFSLEMGLTLTQGKSPLFNFDGRSYYDTEFRISVPLASIVER